ILDANGNPGLDTITFDIDGAGVHVIQPSTPEPTVTDPVVIDGTTQPGYAGVPLIVLNGSSAGFRDGLTITAGNSTVPGLVIDGWGSGNGIALQTLGNNLITGNYIGTDVTGLGSVANNRGVLISGGSSNNTIGGTDPGSGNLISGNGSIFSAAGEAVRIE